MTTRLATQATAFGLAMLVTLATLGSLNQLASHSAQEAASEMAAAEQTPVQQVVIVGKRAMPAKHVAA